MLNFHFVLAENLVNFGSTFFALLAHRKRLEISGYNFSIVPHFVQNFSICLGWDLIRDDHP